MEKEEKSPAASASTVDLQRPVLDRLTHNSMVDTDQEAFFNPGPERDQKKSSFRKVNQPESQKSQLTRLNRSIRQKYGSSTRQSSLSENTYLGRSYSVDGIQSQNLLTEPGNSFHDSGMRATRKNPGFSRPSFLSTPSKSSLTRSSLPFSQQGFGTLKNNSPQTPLQSYQPLSDLSP